MKVSVIGASGYIGSALVEKLKRDGVDVCTFTSQAGSIFDSKTGILSDNFEIPSGTSCLIYLAQSPFYRQVPELAHHLWGVNVISPIKLAELARKANVEHFIYTSTGNVYAPSFNALNEASMVRRDNWYSLSKLHAEEGLALYRSSMDISITRLFGVYGPNQTDKLIPNLIDSIRSGRSIKIASRPGVNDDFEGLRVSLCYIDDVVDLFTKIISKPVNLVNVSGPEILSIRKITKTIGDLLGLDPKIEFVNETRTFDLIADLTNLNYFYNCKFTPFSEGIRRTVGVK